MNSLIHRDHSAIRLWLCACLLLIAMMVMVGGYTRLSGSGLSITQWKPIHGVVPPLNDSEWQEEFAAYQATPQHQLINKGMTLDEFKTIFWPEFWHRILGRLIGAVFFIPLVVFALRKSMARRFALRLLAIFALGGLQGGIGWIMVKSGLQDQPYVSHLKLALHLAMAFALFGLLLWALLDVVASRQSPVASQKTVLLETGDWRLATYLPWFTLLCLQIIYGAFVAGLHAGLVYNTWPDMNGYFLPPEAWEGRHVAFLNLAMVQFIHRTVAVLLAISYILWWYLCSAHGSPTIYGRAANGLILVIALQFTLGVLTLLHAAPLPLALAHQMTALLLFGLAVVVMRGLVKGGWWIVDREKIYQKE